MHAESNNDIGEDELVFVLKDKSNSSVGNYGGGMGYEGISPSFGIEFDTYYNSFDPTYNDQI